tara:strand:- start:53654 stop:54679 length:1026 start_codon:yes stop_codon:yes gene_type:complete
MWPRPSQTFAGVDSTVSDRSAAASNTAPGATSTLAELRREAVIEVTGRDALTFLHNQASCDLKQLAADQATRGTFCNPQGRVLADVLILCLGPEHYRLRLRRSILESTLEALGRFALFSKVTLEPAAEQLQLLGVQGPGARAALEALFDSLPEGLLGWRGDAGATVVQLDEAGEAFELWLDATARSDLATTLREALPADDSESAWELAGLRRGVARITAATRGELLPQQLNYDLTGHINFRKGCYPGQEVIARMHYKGKAKRRLLLMQAPAGSAPADGDSLYLAGKDSPAGQVVNAASDPDGQVLALVTTTDSAASEGLRLAPGDEQSLSLVELPYPVPFG